MPLLSKWLTKTRQSRVLNLVRGDVLELGCADGALYGLCCERIDRYVGIDYSDSVQTTPTSFGNDVIHRLGAERGLFHRSAMDDRIVIYNKKRFQTAAKEFGFALSSYKTFQLDCNQLAILEKQA